MKRTVVDGIAVLTALGVISAGGIGLAGAASRPRAGMTSIVPMSLRNEGQGLKVRHDQLTIELAKLRGPPGRAAMSGRTCRRRCPARSAPSAPC